LLSSVLTLYFSLFFILWSNKAFILQDQNYFPKSDQWKSYLLFLWKFL
jgi:hypothetical protein